MGRRDDRRSKNKKFWAYGLERKVSPQRQRLKKYERDHGKLLKQGYIEFGVKLCGPVKRYCYVFYTLHEKLGEDSLIWDLDPHPEYRGHDRTPNDPFGKKRTRGKILLKKGSVKRREGTLTDHYRLDDYDVDPEDGSKTLIKWYITLRSLKEDFDRTALER